MSYVDGYVVPVPTKNLERYRDLATLAGKIWKDAGALKYVECFAEDTSSNADFGLPFTKAFDIKPDETVVFSYIVFSSRQHRDEVNKKVMENSELKEAAEKYGEVFDCKRMAYSGFEAVVNL